MGANCCVAAKSKSPPNSALVEGSTYRSIRHSPSWSFGWDSRTHIEDIINNPAHSCNYSNKTNGVSAPEMKSEVTAETEGLLDSSSLSNVLQTQRCYKSHKTGSFETQKADLSGQSIESNSFIEIDKSPGFSNASDAKLTVAVPSNQYSSALQVDPFSRSQSVPSDPTSSKKACCSPGFQVSRQISHSKIPSLESLNEKNSPEGRQSFVHSDFSRGGSHGGSSDGWSMRTFTELVASSQRECWSFNSENFLYNEGISTNLDGQQSIHESPGQQACKICSKPLKDRSPWSAQKMVSAIDLSVAAVLVCGHVYHAECLETMTHGGDSYDPPCPICIYGEKTVAKLFGKLERARSKLSRIAVAHVDSDQDILSDHPERAKKVPRMGSSASSKGLLSRPFLQRYFSIGRPSRSLSESESSRKKSFWGRYRRGG